MAVRLTTRFLLFAMTGIPIILPHCCALNYSMTYNDEKMFNDVVEVNRNEMVNLCCPVESCRPRLALFVTQNPFVYDMKGGCHVIDSFDGTNEGNYQCECRSGKSIKWNGVTLRLRRDEEQKKQYQLIKFGSFENHSLDVDWNTVQRFARLPGDPTNVTIPTEGKIKLTCAVEPTIGMNIFWFLKNWTTTDFGWSEVNEYKRSEVRLDELIATPDKSYICYACVGDNECSNHVFNVRDSGPFPFNESVEADPAKNYTGSVQSHVEIECGIDNASYTYMMWVKSAEQIDESEVEMKDQNIIQRSDVDDPSVYHIRELSQDDEGYYTCYVMNTTGVWHRSHHLRVVDAEGTYTTSIIVGVLCGAVICALAGGLFALSKSRRRVRRSVKQIVDVATLRRRIVEIERPSGSDGNRADRPQLTLPIVRIRTEQVIVDDNAARVHEEIPSYQIPLDNPWELRREDLSHIETLNEGSFGRLLTARLSNFIPGGPVEVMIKTLCGNPANDDVRALVSEMETMKAIGSHVNIVSLLGACTQNGPLYVVMEFAKHGSLKSFLQQQTMSAGYTSIRELGAIEDKLPCSRDLVSYARQVANGMQYLASRGCIHRDLAARNVVVCEGHVLKITDYAVMGEDHRDAHPVQGKDGILAVRWMAPEMLFDNYCTIKANVWSYGILLWEIMTFADTPYPLITSNMELLKQLRRGYRMENPKNCPNQIYQLMLKCWSENAAGRPMFEEIVEYLNRILEIAVPQQYQNLFDLPSSNLVNGDDYCDVVRSSLQ